MRPIVIIPAYNEERTVREVVERVRAVVPDVIVIDDGSDDRTGALARAAGARVVRHAVNRGLGAAIGTGIAACFSPSFANEKRGDRVCFSPSRREGELEGVGNVPDIIVTMDADGQHDPADIARLIAPIARGEADVVIGTRFGGEHAVWFSPSHREGELEGVGSAPRSRILANRFANLVTRALFGVRCSDTQSGFRAFSRTAARQLDLRTNRMEVSSEILAEAARLRLRIVEVPIRTIYTEYSLSKGQSFAVGARTAWGLFMRRML